MKLRSTVIAVLLVALILFFKTCSTSPPVHAAVHSATLTWVAPGPMTPPVTYTYNVKRSGVAGGPYTTIQTGVSALTYTDTPLTANTKVCYVVSTSVVGMSESVNSNEFCATTPQDAAPNPSGLAVTVQ